MVALSILDLAFVTEGSTPADALHNSVDLARHAEQWGAYPDGSSSWLARNHERPGGLRGARHGDGLGYSAVSIDDRSLQRRDRGSAGGRGVAVIVAEQG